MGIADDFHINRKKDLLQISFPSTMENIDLADKETRKFLTDHDLPSEVFSVCLCMREGLTNAVRHGNRDDASKTVQYSLALSGNRLIMEISDEGEGFDWKRIGEKEPLFASDHGRGLVIIRRYFSSYRFNARGNKLTMVKILPSDPS